MLFSMAHKRFREALNSSTFAKNYSVLARKRPGSLGSTGQNSNVVYPVIMFAAPRQLKTGLEPVLRRRPLSNLGHSCLFRGSTNMDDALLVCRTSHVYCQVSV